MILTLIVAMNEKRVIGRDNKLPWHLPADLKYFKAATMGKPVVMGRKTFDSIGKALPGRRNIVITRNGGWHAEGVEIVNSVDAALACTADAEEVMIIGGAEIFDLTMDRADRLMVTEVDLDVPGDTFFPEIDTANWRETARINHPADGQTPAYAYVTYERV